ncbi:MAG: AbrB/MazE/SpoVT family DNA-binding domain-containing protein [Allosphingosinicella sp.]|uniref:AbrB/MazE/SpoVT family DNA-binding domain-containing protein n=1 Tax=Allosphingosinicella sp. TaxID=2823234 RepID=UPI0039339D51
MNEQRNLTVKGQVTIPKDVRDALGLRPGEPVEFERRGDEVVIRKGMPTHRAAEARQADMRRRIAEARTFAIPLTEMTADDYMAGVREPVPVQRGR